MQILVQFQVGVFDEVCKIQDPGWQISHILKVELCAKSFTARHGRLSGRSARQVRWILCNHALLE
jgi:hypothetical protein